MKYRPNKGEPYMKQQQHSNVQRNISSHQKELDQLKAKLADGNFNDISEKKNMEAKIKRLEDTIKRLSIRKY